MEVVLVRSRAPRGVLMVFHGCTRRPTDWWHYEPTCVTCIGARACWMYMSPSGRSLPEYIIQTGRVGICPMDKSPYDSHR